MIVCSRVNVTVAKLILYGEYSFAYTRVQRRMISVDNVYVFLRLLFFALLLLYVT